MKYLRNHKVAFFWLGCLLIGSLFVLLTCFVQHGIAQEAPSTSFASEVIGLVNQERTAQGLPPLKENPELNAAAKAHSQAMAEENFFNHTNPGTDSTPGDRVAAAGYEWSFVAENIGQGYSTPDEVVEGWMDSSGHRANILSTDAREIGVGYAYDADDDVLCGDLPCEHYWTQDFGARTDYYPVIINNEVISTTTSEVDLYIYGQEWAEEMRFRNDGESFSEWELFTETKRWTLPAGEGLYTVTVELRDDSTVYTASDDIYLMSSSLGELATSTPTPTLTPPPSLPPSLPGVISVGTTPKPLELKPDQSTDVALALDTASLPACHGVPGNPVDVMLVYDISDSAGVGARSNWEQTVTFTLQLLDHLTQPIYRQRTSAPERSRLGLITSQTGTFGPEPRLLENLSKDHAALRDSVISIQPGGDTEIAAGIDLAAEILTEASDDRAQAIVLMLHDNKAIDQAAIEAVQDISDQIPVYIIANSKNLAEVDIINTDLASQLVTDDKFYSDPKPDAVRHLFVTATEGDPDAVVRDLQITDEFVPAVNVELSDVTGSNGQIEGPLAVWHAETLEEGDALDLGYTARVPVEASGSIERTGRATYLDCNGYLQTRILWEETIYLTSVTPTHIPSPTPVITAPTITPSLSSSPSPEATLTPLPATAPVTMTLSLCPGTSSSPYLMDVDLPPAPAQADVLFIFDVSGSMESVLNSAASNADTIMQNLVNLLGSDVQFGVVSFSDYPREPYGATGDHPYELVQAITSDQSSVKSALNRLSLEDGKDGPEAYTRAFYEVYADPAMGWRNDARHFIVVFGDSFPHDDDLNAGVPEPQPLEPGAEWITGEAPSYRDPGRDGKPGTSDDLDFQSVLQELGEEKYTLLHVISGEGAGVDKEKLLPYWQAWAKQTPGGEAVYLDDAAQIPQVVQDLVAGAAREIDELILTADPGYKTWLTTSPPVYEHLEIITGGISSKFEAVFTVPHGTPAGSYNFQVRAVGDGTVYDTWSVTIDVPESCAPSIGEPECVTPEQYCTEWYWKLLPFLLPLLAILLWWLLQPLLCGPDWLEKKRKRGWKCWIPCLLALLVTLVVAYLMGRWLSDWLCHTLASRPEPAPVIAATPAPDARPATSGSLGQDGSQNVAVIIHGGLLDLSSERPGVSFAQIEIDDLTAETLAQYDTLVLSQVCNVSQLPAPQLAAIVNWVAAGHKLIIYDSDECAEPVNYDWLPYCFTTSNPGARGSTSGEFVIVAEDSMISADPDSPIYVDEAEMSASTEIGDANVMITQDVHWCCNAEAENLLGQRGCVHAYAFYGTGLIIYNGLDTDSISAPAQYQLWQNELAQPWDSVEGTSMGLPCQRRVVGVGAFPWWLLIPLPLLWLLAWWLCCRQEPESLPPLPPLRGKPSPRPPLTFTDHWIGPPPEWDPAPALVIGLGGTGRWVLTHLKKNLIDAGIGECSDQVRLLALDTSPAERVEGQKVTVDFAGVELDEDELLVLSENLRDVCHQMVRDPKSHPELQAWFPAEEYLRVRRLPDAELDVRKGTRGRRPMGRAAALQDIRQEEASLLWQRLLTELRRVLENQRAQIFIVGSLAGGFGSAVVADVAYLARCAARITGASEGVVISGLLATDNAFVAQTRAQKLRLNAMAALRELRRFQLASGRPYPMTYVQESSVAAFNGYCEWGLLDDLFLFDGQRPERALTRYEPTQALFPMMSDALTTLLDRAAHPLEEGRANTRVDASAEQLAHGEAMVSSLGSFVYRLPMYDIVEELKVRFAKDLLRLYLVGPEFEGPDLILQSDQNREPYPDGIAALVQHFLQEEVGGATAWVANLVRAGIVPTVAESIALTAAPREQAFLEEQLNTFRTNLTGRLLLILNGSPDVDAITARSGKLGYAQDFLDELHEQLKQAQGQARVMQSSLSETGADGAHLLDQLIAREIEIVKTRSEELEAGIAFLLGRKGVHTPDAKAPQHGVFDRLREELEQRSKQRRNLQEIVVRHYFADDELVDELYRDYFAPHLEPNLERLFWSESEDEDIELTIRHWEDVVMESGRAGAETFQDALLDLAGAMSQEVWKLRLSDFLDEVETGLWRETVLQEEADRVRSWADPTVVYQIGRAPRSLIQRFLWVNRTVQRAKAFRQMIRRLAKAGEVGRLQATDPYSAGLLTTLDIVPLSALKAVRERLEVDYRHAYAVSDETAGVTQPHLLPEPIHVYPAERHALQYEQRLHELNEPPRLFHPLFVAALDDLKRARTFALAYALGLIRQRYHRGERREGQRYQVILPGQAEGGSDEEVWLTRHDRPTDPLALVVRAMQGFVLGHPEEDVVQSQYSSQRLYRAVAQAVEARAAEQQARLQEFLSETPGDLRNETRLGVQDFLSFARLVVRDELQRLYQADRQS
jgi:hypothetical protein